MRQEKEHEHNGIIMQYDIPSTVIMNDGAVTMRFANGNPNNQKSKSMKSIDECDAYENPTELFQWINYGNYQSAAIHALEHPEEARTWIVSKVDSKKGRKTKWRYLPLHLVCMKQNSSEDLIRALIFTYPNAAKEKDHDGNLPIQHLLESGGAHTDIIQLLLRSYPESVHKRDRKGRTLLEIVSEGYRSGKISKDSMVNSLAILRQWTLAEEHKGTNLSQQREVHDDIGGYEQRDDIPITPMSFSFDAQDVEVAMQYEKTSKEKNKKDRRRNSNSGRGSRSKSRSSRPFASADTDDVVIRSPPKSPRRKEKRSSSGRASHSSKKSVSSHLEVKLEDTMTERDILRDTVSQMKSEQMNQEMALVALNKQVASTSTELSKGKEKIKKKKEKIEELEDIVRQKEDELKKKDDGMAELAQKLEVTEKTLTTKETAIVELKDLIDSMGDENKSFEKYVAKFERVREQNEQLNMRIEELARVADEEANRAIEIERGRRESERTAEAELREAENEWREIEQELKDTYEAKIKDLRNQLIEKERGEIGVSAIRIEAAGAEGRYKARIASLEKDLLAAHAGKNLSDGDQTIRSQHQENLEGERDALKEMNASLQEHVGALKERCSKFEQTEEERHAFHERVKILESELLQTKLIKHSLEDEIETARSEALIVESKLQTKIARIEKEFLEALSEKDSIIKAAHESTAEEDQARLQEEKTSLQVMNLSLKEHVEALQQKCGALESSVDVLKDEGDKKDINIKALKKEMREQHATIMHKKDEMKRLIFTNETKLSEAIDEKEAEMQGEIRRLVLMIEDMSSKNESEFKTTSQLEHEYQEKIKSQVDEIRGLSLAKDRLIVQQETRQIEFDSLKKSHDELRGTVIDLEKQNAKLKNDSSDTADILHGLRKARDKTAAENDDLKTEVADIKKEAEILEQNNSRLRGEVDYLSKNLEKTKSNLSDALKSSYTERPSDSARDLRQELQELKESNLKLKEENDSLLFQLRQIRGRRESRNELFEEENDELRSQVRELRDQLETRQETQDPKSKQDSDVKMLEARNEKLRSQRASLENENDELRAQIRGMRNELEDSKREVASPSKHDSSWEKLEKENDSLRAQISELRVQIEGKQETFPRSKVESMQIKLEDENDKLRDQVRELRIRLERRQDASSSQDNSRQLLEEQNGKLRDQVRELRIRLETRQEAGSWGRKDSFQEMAQREKVQRETTEREMLQLKQQHEDLISTVGSLENDLKDAKEREMRSQIQIEELNEQRRIQNTETDEKHTEAATLEIQVKDMAQQIEAYKTQIQELQTGNGIEIGGMKTQTEKYKKQMADLKSKFEAVKTSNTKLRGIIAQNNDTYIAKVESLSSELADLRQMNGSLHEHIHELSVENDKMRESVSMINQNAGTSSTKLQEKLNKMSERLNKVSAYLMAVTSFQQDTYKNIGAGSESKSPRNRIRGQQNKEVEFGEVLNRQTEVTKNSSKKDREDMLNFSIAYGKDLKTGTHSIGDDMLRHQVELNEISRALDNIQRE